MMWELCYTVTMDADRHIWREWASFLQRWGVDRWVASFLEAAGPFNILGAQLIYLGQPIFGQNLSRESMNALTRLLEDTIYTRAFVDYLREAPAK
jgi:hypothetical protein